MPTCALEAVSEQALQPAAPQQDTTMDNTQQQKSATQGAKRRRPDPEATEATEAATAVFVNPAPPRKKAKRASGTK